MTKNWKKITAENFFLFFFWSKTAIYLSLGLHKVCLSYRRSLHFLKEAIQHFKTWTFTNYCLLLWVIFALLDPDPDSEYGSGSTDPIEYGSNPDPDPQPCYKSLPSGVQQSTCITQCSVSGFFAGSQNIMMIWIIEAAIFKFVRSFRSSGPIGGDDGRHPGSVSRHGKIPRQAVRWRGRGSGLKPRGCPPLRHRGRWGIVCVANSVQDFFFGQINLNGYRILPLGNTLGHYTKGFFII